MSLTPLSVDVFRLLRNSSRKNEKYNLGSPLLIPINAAIGEIVKILFHVG